MFIFHIFNKSVGVMTLVGVVSSAAITSQLPTLVFKSQIWRLISKASSVEHSKLKTSSSTQKKYFEHSVVDQTRAGSLKIKNKIILLYYNTIILRCQCSMPIRYPIM